MIKDNMRFDTFCDFYCRKKYIRALYIALNKDDKILYKYYVYSRRSVRDKVCDMIWEYLNGEGEEEMVIYTENLDKERSRYL